MPPDVVQQQLREILDGGSLVLSSTALEEMDDESLSEIDVVNMLRAGELSETDQSKTTYRSFRAETSKMAVHVELRNERELVVVSAWRKR